MDKSEREYVEGLRAMADFLEEHPEGIPTYTGIVIDHYPGTKADLVAKAREIGGKWDKADLGSIFLLKQSFGPHSIEINVDRSEVCERVATGEMETVTMTDPNAPKITVTQPVYEWKCPESLLADAEAK
jgi:hypothetical protein